MTTEDNIADEFNAFSVNYTQDMIKCVPYYSELIGALSNELPEGFNPEYILDLGCGNGNVTSSLLKRFPAASYTLLDASSEMLGICRNRFQNYKMNFVLSYFEDYAFESERYDLVAAGFSLHHCNSEVKQSIFRSIYQSLRTGGVFGCSDLMISKDNPDHSALLKNWKYFVSNNFPDDEKWNWLMDHYDKFDHPDWIHDQVRWLKEVGFKEIKVKANETYWVNFQAKK